MKILINRLHDSSRAGTIVILFAVMLVVVLAFVAVSVDLGYVCSVDTDLQVSADAGALAGTSVVLTNPEQAELAATQFARMNLNNLGVRADGNQKIDVQLGHWDFEQRQFYSGKTPLTAVSVNLQVANNSLFFSRALGTSQFTSQATAIAACRPRDIMLVLDVSGSMAESRRGVRKIDELRGALVAFFGYLREVTAEDRVGFSYYAARASLGSSLDDDLSSVEAAVMGKLSPLWGTNIADGMRLALEEFEARGKRQASPLMVVLTDGAANMNQPGDWEDHDEAKRRVIVQATEARKRKIPIFTIALDSLSEEVDVELMKRVAEMTGSESYHVIAGEEDINGGSKLRKAFHRVAFNRPPRIVD